MVNNYIGLHVRFWSFGLQVRFLVLWFTSRFLGPLVFGCKYTGYLFTPLFVMLHLFFFMSHTLKCALKYPYFTVF